MFVRSRRGLHEPKEIYFWYFGLNRDDGLQAYIKFDYLRIVDGSQLTVLERYQHLVGKLIYVSHTTTNMVAIEVVN